MSKELKKRIITSIVLIAIALNCLFINNFSWLLLLSIVSFICWFEFIDLNKKILKKKTIIILPIISGVFIAQTIKILTRIFKKEKVTWKQYLAYSGMPSGHSAMVVSLTTIIGLREGVDSAIFGLSFIFAF